MPDVRLYLVMCRLLLYLISVRYTQALTHETSPYRARAGHCWLLLSTRNCYLQKSRAIGCSLHKQISTPFGYVDSMLMMYCRGGLSSFCLNAYFEVQEWYVAAPTWYQVMIRYVTAHRTQKRVRKSPSQVMPILTRSCGGARGLQ